jgi:23S rRNA pseudouridine1911/1915/1917 synthase
MILTADLDGERADRFLARTVEQLSRSAAQRLLEEGAVTKNGVPVGKNEKLLARGCADPDAAPSLPRPMFPRRTFRWNVVYEDADIIVVNKPVGMVVHPAPGHADGNPGQRAAASLQAIAVRDRRPAAPGIVHRIDRDTSGLIIAAKNDAAHLALAAQLQEHSLTGNMRRW